MIYWLLRINADLLEARGWHATGDSRVFLTARTAVASVTSFLLALLLGPIAIRWLKSRFTERIDSASARLNELHADKANTPTMGGLFVVGATVLATLLFGDLTSVYVQLALVVAVGLGGLGAADDWTKLSTKRNGLKARTKLAVQATIALGVGWVLANHHANVPHGTDLVWPIGNATLALGVLFVPWAVLVLVGSSNAVNLTDGLDGLASGCTIFAGTAFVALTYLAGHAVLADYLGIPFVPGAGEMTVVMGALVGAVLGFLWFNCYPAQVFLGDTGSLPIGGLLGLAALVARQEVLLVVVGGVFVVETLSVILQVGWFKLTGRRVLRCSPLHNHYVFAGQHELKIVVRFWIGSALLALVAVASLKIP